MPEQSDSDQPMTEAGNRLATYAMLGHSVGPRFLGDDLRAEIEALIRTPDGRHEWHNQGRSGFTPVVDVSRLRAALDRVYRPGTAGGGSGD